MYFCKGEKESNCLDIKNLTTIVSMNNVKNLTTCLQKEKDFKTYYYSLEKRESSVTNYVKFTTIGHGFMAIFMV